MQNTFSLYGKSPLWDWMTSDVEDYFDRALSRASDQMTRNVIPYEMQETDAGYFMAVDLPGVRKEDLKIEIVERALTVTGERKRGEGTGQKIFCRFAIPKSADTDRIEANLEHGVLEIAMPKAETAKPRTIQIQSGTSGIFSKLIGSSKKERTVNAN